MKKIEIQAQRFTEDAWFAARESGVEFETKQFAVMQECELCKKLRGIGYIYFTEENIPVCIFCNDPVWRNNQTRRT